MLHSRTGWPHAHDAAKGPISHRVAFVLCVMLAVPTCFLLYTDPTLRNFALAGLAWTGGIFSFILTAGARSRTEVEVRG